MYIQSLSHTVNAMILKILTELNGNGNAFKQHYEISHIYTLKFLYLDVELSD